jgi:alpha-L-fucosidase
VIEHEVPTWFRDAKLGILVHWGPSSVPGWAPLGLDPMARGAKDGWETAFAENAYAEWYQNSINIEGSPAWKHHQEVWAGRAYFDFADDFAKGSAAWDPDDWASLFRTAGARYVVLTTKHHDGYLLWPSRHPNPHRDAWQSTGDIVGDITGAVRDHGMRMGLYYSGGIDWTFGGLPITDLPSMFRSLPTGDDYAAYADAHWRELIDRYQPSVLWNDIGYPPQADHHRLFTDYYNAVPEGVVNDRFDMMGAVAGTPHWDFRTPEYAQMDDITEHAWESVRGIAHSFGYNQLETDADLVSSDELVHLLVDIVSKNGNLLLGVGPTGDGTVPDIQARRLVELGRWLDVNGAAIFGTRPWKRPAAGPKIRFTCTADALHVIFLGDERTVDDLIVPAGSDVKLLGGGAASWNTEGGSTTFDLRRLPNSPAHVVRISPLP